MTFEVFPPRAESVDSFSQLADAEAFLKSQGFWLIANTCDWTNIDGADAGVYSFDGYWGEVKGWRVEINRHSDHHHRPDERPLCASPKPDDELGMAWWNALSERERKHWLSVADPPALSTLGGHLGVPD